MFRLSSKSHWDVPIAIGQKTVHFLVSHPTPPVFDGPEDRNGTRNHDEIRFWADYITPGARAGYIYDDAGERGGLEPGSLFVIAGDQNADPLDGDCVAGAIQQLLDHPLVNTENPPDEPGRGRGVAAPGRREHDPPRRPELRHRRLRRHRAGQPARRLRAAAPQHPVRRRSAVFWPLQADPLFRLTGVFPFPSSDHRLVWVDVKRP